MPTETNTSVAPAPSYADILAVTIAAMQSVAVTTVAGTTVLLDMSPGSYNLALAVAVAANVAALYQRQSDVQVALDFTQNSGADLDRSVALLGVEREGAVQATKPLLVGRSQVSSSAVQVPVNWRFSVQTASGPVDYLAQQGQGEPPDVALTVPGGSTQGWVVLLADATDPASVGVAGNTPTNLPASFGAAIPGLDTIANPPAGVPTLPTYTITGATGSSVRYYRAVGNGVTGKTLPGPVLTVSNAHATLDSTHHVDLTFGYGTDGGAVQPVSYDVLVSTDNATWFLLGTVIATGAATTFSDTGQVTQSYVLPVSDSSNWGVGGANEESDQALRDRAPNTIAARSAATGTAVGAAVANVAGVASAYGVDISPGVGQVQIVTVASPPSSVTTAAVSTAIAVTKALGAQISADYITPTLVNVTYTIIAQSNVADPTTLYTPIQVAISTYMAGLALGAAAYVSNVIQSMMSVLGVQAVQSLTLTVGVTNYTSGAVPATPGVVYRIGTITPGHT